IRVVLVAEVQTCALPILTPPALNRETCLAAVRAGKPLLIEKPLALTVADAQEMVRAAREAGITLMTAQTLRFTPVLARLRDRLRSEERRVGKEWKWLWLG